MTDESPQSTIRRAQTDDERRAVYRFRYGIYVEEMGRYRSAADHENRELIDPEDESSHLFFSEWGGEIDGAIRITWGGDGPVSSALQRMRMRFEARCWRRPRTIGAKCMKR